MIILREVGVVKVLSVASRENIKPLPTYNERNLAMDIESKKSLETIKNMEPLANTSFLPPPVLQYTHSRQNSG